MIYLSFTTFTLLWIISCTVLYFGLLRRNEEVFQKMFEANQFLEDAKKKNAKAQRDMDEVMLRLSQIERSLNCLN